MCVYVVYVPILPGRYGGGGDIGYATASVFKTNISDLLYYYYRAMGDIMRFFNNEIIRCSIGRLNIRITLCRFDVLRSVYFIMLYYISHLPGENPRE